MHYSVQTTKNISTFDMILLSIIASLFVFSDWIVGAFSLTELLIFPTVLIMAVAKKISLNKTAILWMALPIGFVAIHTLISYLSNEAFDLKVGLYGLIKLSFYVVVISIFISYIKANNFQKNFLTINNVVAVIIGLIGIYITVAIYSDGILPYEFFWRFTRYDGYLFSTDTFYVRTLSIFYEPAHMGYYLNTILAINLFSKFNFKLNYFFNFLIVIFVLTTFSYSAIAVMGILLVLSFIKRVDFRKIKLDWKLLIPIVALLIIYFVFQETIHTTIIDRTVLILQGKEPSVNERLKDSWKYINESNIWLGNGIGHTPVVWHNFAYMISEFGIIGIALFSGFSLFLTFKNVPLGLFFIAMNFSKGGYLSPAFWFLVMMILLYDTLVDKKHYK
ncbi:hypothetical protein VXN63_03935 [Marinilactibacillus sp. XAAS-LB27]|uniref:hypothetical protein n=1 Tax=Marinilactibacillus sp. XAAS-LB27 TaxID=3114538 RepID=UPI002E172F2C|nr:hypothetical protein [Marinilactibacillus sp. XAAS-LB27]